MYYLDVKKFVLANQIYLLGLVLLVGGLAIRLAVSNSAVHGDLIMQAGWGWWIKHNGLKGFYENTIWIYGWPNHPPLINMMYGLGFYLFDWLNKAFVDTGTFIALHRLIPTKFLWFYNFNRWWGSALYGETPYRVGELISIKLMPIICDMLVGLSIYLLALKRRGTKIAFTLGALYLFSPFSWYLSGVWGQSDQISFMTLFGAVALLFTRFSLFGPILFFISAGLKPTTLIFTPYFFWLGTKDRKTLVNLILGTLASIGLYILLAAQFTNLDFISFNKNLQRQMFVKGELWTWVNTFNFWRIINDILTPYSTKFFFLSYKTWGYIAFGLFNLIAMLINKNRNFYSSLLSMFIVGFSGWMFMVTMHDRYMYSALAFGIISAIYLPRLIKYWLAISIIFWINLFNGWWIPNSFSGLRAVLEWQDGLVTRGLALINLILFIKMTQIIVSYMQSRNAKS